MCVVSLFQSDKEHEEKIAEQREKQRRLITQLKSQLEDLETYAYEVSCLRQCCSGAARFSRISYLGHKLPGSGGGSVVRVPDS